MKKLALVTMTCFLTLNCSSNAKKEATAVVATSDIPDRREFPVNPEVKPCQDFYQYVCSKVNETFKLRDDRSYHDFAFSDSAERLLVSKKKFLQELGAQDQKKMSGRSRDLTKIYGACMNEEASAAEERKLVHRVIAEVDKIKTREQLEKFLGDKIVSEDDTFLGFDSVANLDNPDLYDVVIISGLQHLPERSYYENPEVIKDFTAIAAELLKIAGRDQPEQRAEQAISFEKEFSKTFPLPAEFRELFNSRTQISRSDLMTKFPHLHLKELLSRLPSKTLLRNVTPDNFEFLNKAIETRDLEMLKDVYLLNVLPNYMDDAYPEFFKRRFAFSNKHLGGPPVRPDRQERCTKEIMGSYAKEIDAELMPRLFPGFPAQRIVGLAETIRHSIISGLQNNTWLSDQGRKAAIAKMTAARLQLVQPRNDAEWDFNPKAPYNIKTPYANRRMLRLNLIKKKLAELRKPRNKSRWEFGPLTVNAYYSPPDNKFVLPIGILQYPFFDPALTDQANLGGVGAVVGHELGHGIDDNGSKYDENGKFNEWMTPQDLSQFKSRGEKLVAQFDKIGHNGKLTLGENIGDLVGVTFAYRAAFPEGKGSEEEKRAFFIQYGRLWCNVIRPKFRENLLKTNPHALGEARTNQQVKNQPGFAEAFQCHEGDPMVLPAKDRVKIW